MPFLIVLFAGLLLTGNAVAQTSGGINWSMLQPSNDWTAEVLRSLVPVAGNAGGAGEVQNQRSVLGTLLGMLSGFIGLIVIAWFVYASIVQLKRVAYERRVMSESIHPLMPLRVALAMMFLLPIYNGTGVAQALIVQGGMGAIGMARLAWSEAVRAIGPDAVPIATPIIPGTKTIVSGLMQNEMCRAIIASASANAAFAPPPVAVRGGTTGEGAYLTYPYRLAVGNAGGAPVCGTATIRQPGGMATLHGVDVDMTERQAAILEDVLVGIIRPGVEAAAQALWDTRRSASLAPLQGVYVEAVGAYTAALTQEATALTQRLRAAVTADRLRNGGQSDRNEFRLAALGWAGAGAYFLEMARLNGATLSVLSSVPVVNPPNYADLGPHFQTDLKPMMATMMAWRDQMATHAATTDGLDVPGGYADLFTGASPGDDGAGVLEKITRAMRLNERVLNGFMEIASPTRSMWQNPFLAQIQLGHMLMLVSLGALGMAAALASTPIAAGVVAANVLTLNFTGAAAAATGHLAVSFLAGPLWFLCLGMLVPGMLLAYVLPMLPYFFFIVRVLGWLVQILELIVLCPIWLARHVTYRGEGLHGQALQGYGQMFSILVTPVLSIIGLFCSIFLYGVFCWLLQMTFGIAAGFVLMNGWLVTNIVGLVVLCCSFVLCHIVAITQCCRLISIIPHHAMRLVGFDSSNRIDTESVARDMGVVGLANALQSTQSALTAATGSIKSSSTQAVAQGAQRRAISAPLDRTTSAATSVSRPEGGV